MSAVDHAFLATILSFDTRADLSTFDCSYLRAGQIAFVAQNIGSMNAPDDADFPYYTYRPSSTAVVDGTATLYSANARATAGYEGRWIRMTWAPTTPA